MNQPNINKFATELSKLVNKYGESPMSPKCDRLYKRVRDLSDKFDEQEICPKCYGVGIVPDAMRGHPCDCKSVETK